MPLLRSWTETKSQRRVYRGPEERSDQGFDDIGWASRIISRYFMEQTVEGDQVIQLTGEPAPEWFVPLANWDFKRSRLPLWLFYLQHSAAIAGAHGATAAQTLAVGSAIS